MNLFSKMTTKQKENFSFAIFRSDVLTGGYKLSAISGENLPVCGPLLNFVVEDNLAKVAAKLVTAGRIIEEFAKLLDDKLL